MLALLAYLSLLAIGSKATGVQFAGVNIAGFDFGCTTDGTCVVSSAVPPLASLGGPDGKGQMTHFVNNDKLNIFRLPVGWQYLTNGVIGALDATKSGNYDQLVQACLGTGAYCIIDIHNYARWNGGIIGQGGPSNSDFAYLWQQLATKYKSDSKVVFGLMNEPHDLVVSEWVTTVQAAVTAIRNAGATSQMILLPGSSYTSVYAMPLEAGPALLAVTNPDGSTTNLIFDVHQYLDSDNSGTHAECTQTGVTNIQNLATWLSNNGRKAILSETGGGNVQSCWTDVCAELDTMNYSPNQYLGWTGWAAGSFDTIYVLTETPTDNGGVWTDQSLVASCIVGKFTPS